MSTDPNLDIDDTAIPFWWAHLPTPERDRWITAYENGLDADLADSLEPDHQDGGPDPWVRQRTDPPGWFMDPEFEDYIFERGYEGALHSANIKFWMEEAQRRGITTDAPLQSEPDAADENAK
jgi:hypothetical protein